MITLVGYGLGNVRALKNLYRQLNIEVEVASTPKQLITARKLILPGVGSFDWAMKSLIASGMRDTLDELVLAKKVPVLGICVGMQMMARSSEEGSCVGLGWVDAEVKRIEVQQESGRLSLPHMGWNTISLRAAGSLFAEMDEEARFYFLHSYYFLPRRQSDVLGRTDYGGLFASAIKSGNIYGTQFHPEKSHRWGVQLLKNFAEI